MNKSGHFDAAQSFSEQLARTRKEHGHDDSKGGALKYLLAATLILGVGGIGALLLSNRDELMKKFEKKGAA